MPNQRPGFTRRFHITLTKTKAKLMLAFAQAAARRLR